jgi:hypothetical protein
MWYRTQDFDGTQFAAIITDASQVMLAFGMILEVM